MKGFAFDRQRQHFVSTVMALLSAANPGATQDVVILEGWWLKRGGKGNLNKKPHHRYYIVTERYFDWYEKPVRLGLLTPN